MRILLSGISGQLGGELQQKLAPLGDVVGVDRQQLDLAQPDSIRGAIAELQPNLIINSGAYTAVDKAETEADLAQAINGTAPKILAEAALELGASLIHISTDYVFDGTQNTPYLESNRPNPLGVYGRSKLAGEQGIEQVAAASGQLNYLILRTAWVYGVLGKGNFVKTMLRLGAEREEIRVVADQVGTPTWTGDIASAIAQLIPKFCPQNDPPTAPSGIYHFTNSGVASWYDFAVAIFEEARALDFPLKVQNVIPIATVEYPTPARRPAYSVLSGKKIASVLGSAPSHWRQALRSMLAAYRAASFPN